MLIELIINRNSIGFDYYKEIIQNYREIKETLNIKKIAEYISNFAIENYLYDVIMKEVFYSKDMENTAKKALKQMKEKEYYYNIPISMDI